MNQSNEINELALALSKAQAEIMPALKDTTNPFFKSKYADLTSVWGVCREPLSKNGLAVVQTTAEENNKPFLITTLMHSSGQWIRSYTPIITTKNDAQGFGAAMTYMRRYSLSAMIGICQEDDDGNTASGLISQTSKQPVKSVNQLINASQLLEISDALAKVPTYATSCLSHLSKAYGITDLSKLPQSMFFGLMNSIKQEISKNQKELVNA